MNIKFCGAAGTTTGSQHLIEVNGARILLDCGLFQGRRKESFERNRNFNFDPRTIDVVVLSHAHIDHSGNLPNLFNRGYQGNIFSTFATRDLCQLMLADSARIQTSDIEHMNKRRKKNNQPPLEPIYTVEQAERCLRNFISLDYHRPIKIADGVTLTFYDAGHILGAAQVVLDVEEAGREPYRLYFSGDIGRPEHYLLRNPEPVENIDYLLMESTYGGREHESSPRSTSRVKEIIERTLDRNGKIIIPAFAVGRTQQILYIVHELIAKKELPNISVIVDSPMAVNATEIFRIHPECFNPEMYESLFERSNAFSFENLRLVRSVAESKKINQSKKPALIISASGMCEAGRILHHLSHGIGNPNNTVLFVGYCAENTLGSKIRRGDEKINIFGEQHKVSAEIESIDAFSGHADHSELIDHFDQITGSKQKVFLVHGEPSRSSALAADMTEKYPQTQTRPAEYLETISI